MQVTKISLMSEITTPRLMAAAKEFNIGKDTLVDFLVDKGFSKDELKPTAKLTEKMYRSLQQEFQSDKAAKLKSDQIDLPKGASAEARKKKDEVEIVFAKEDKRPIKKEEPKEVLAPVEVIVPAIELATSTLEILKVETQEITGPKVITKIDLNAIDSSTRPKKIVKPVIEKKKPAEEVEGKKPIKKKPQKEDLKEQITKAAIPTPIIPQEPAVIENIRVEKLEGPKILGKIELPVDSDTSPIDDEKRKRKRIPIEKRQVKRSDAIKDGSAKRFEPGGRGGHRPSGGQGMRSSVRADVKEIDEKAIQEKIRETQAKLSGAAGKGKSIKGKHRKAKKDELAEAEGEAAANNILQLSEFISVSELASLMDVDFSEVISKCMSLGIMVSINQRLDAEVIELVAGEFNFTVAFIDMEKQMEMEEMDEDESEESKLLPRSPIVTIMGHVDHGKTSLLDYIRRANVVAGEAGGITQHIGAYRVEIEPGKEITFLDTPGHEAFTAMRARGAKITDVAIIVIAADDAIMPQTREAISHAQAAGVPMIFAINKIDKDGANPKKIFEQLSQLNLLVEEWGGKYQSQEISAKSGLNVDLLLEKILLEAELLALTADTEKNAVGTVIEASLDKGRGYIATVLVQNGTLKVGDIVVSGQHFGKVKAMFNERSQKLKDAPPSAPVLILGLNGAPQAGEKFRVYDDEAEAKATATKRAQILREQGIRTKKHITLDEIGRRLALGNFKELNVIIKGDVDGSVEALSDSLQKLSTPEIAVRIIHKAVGQITESDVTLANASDAIIIGFNVRPSMQAAKLAENEAIEIKQYSIIYKAIDEVKMAMEGMLEPTIKEKIVGNVAIKEVYKFDKATVAGCVVIDGKIKRDSKIRLIRDGIVIYPSQEGASAELGSLKRFKDDAKEVLSGMECGLTVKNYIDIKVGDIVEAFEEEEVKRTL
ncbi:MAG: translation initiation factor IF-2 [Chitinophagaceae bacterium]|nr:MAG: translation initiation factor IF-2 [Chitinophagaceae bacterium]